MGFLAYDLTLLGIFIVFLGIFLYRRRKNIQKEGLLLLYKTSWGIKLIDKIGTKYKKTLNVLSYVSVTTGYMLTAGTMYLVGKLVWIYALNPTVVRAVKIPPIMPLIPYLPQIFKLNLPPFYFTYWIIIIAVVAIFHEFAHGIFAAKSKVKIKSTGFGFFPFFLPIFLAAFVEPDDEQMQKKKIFDQLAVLSAGTFANLITAIIGLGLMIGFFALVFTPSGIAFDAYPYAQINTSSITFVGNHAVANPTFSELLSLMNNTGFNIITAAGESFAITKSSLEKQNETPTKLIMYYNAPAVKANLESIILDINGQKITSVQKLSDVLSKFSPGDKINVTVMGNGSKAETKSLVLGTDPVNQSKAFLGVGFSSVGSTLGRFYAPLNPFNTNGRTYIKIYSSIYSSRMGDLGIFIYNLLWWLVIICFSVALLNMAPMGIFDGGRFFYLTVFGITKNEKLAKNAYKFMTYLILAALAAVMFFWVWYIR